MTLGDKIRFLRAKKDWSLEELGVKSGVGISTLSRLENGETKKTKPSNLQQLAKAFGILVNEFTELSAAKNKALQIKTGILSGICNAPIILELLAEETMISSDSLILHPSKTQAPTSTKTPKAIATAAGAAALNISPSRLRDEFQQGGIDFLAVPGPFLDTDNSHTKIGTVSRTNSDAFATLIVFSLEYEPPSDDNDKLNSWLEDTYEKELQVFQDRLFDPDASYILSDVLQERLHETIKSYIAEAYSIESPMKNKMEISEAEFYEFKSSYYSVDPSDKLNLKRILAVARAACEKQYDPNEKENDPFEKIKQQIIARFSKLLICYNGYPFLKQFLDYGHLPAEVDAIAPDAKGKLDELLSDIIFPFRSMGDGEIQIIDGWVRTTMFYGPEEHLLKLARACRDLSKPIHTQVSYNLVRPGIHPTVETELWVKNELPADHGKELQAFMTRLRDHSMDLDDAIRRVEKGIYEAELSYSNAESATADLAPAVKVGFLSKLKSDLEERKRNLVKGEPIIFKVAQAFDLGTLECYRLLSKYNYSVDLNFEYGVRSD